MTSKGLWGRADYSFGPGTSPVAGATLSALTTAAITAPVFEFTHISPRWGLFGGAAVAAASVAAMAAFPALRHEGRAMCYRAACWLGAGLWSWWQLDHHPWSWNGTAGLGVGAAVAAVVGKALQRAEDRAVAAELDQAVAEHLAAHPPLPDGSPAALAQEWVTLIATVARLQVDIPNVEHWDNGCGFTLDVELPRDGTTIDDLKRHETALATAAGLRPGCNVEVGAADETVARTVVHVRVNTVNAMAADQPMPDEWNEGSINGPVELGVVADGSRASISLRERCLALVAESGAGKSSTLRALIRRLAMNTDTVLMMIDTKGGGEAARMWVRPWFEGRAARPVLIRVANTDHLARLLVAGLVNVVDGRPRCYAELMHRQNTDKIMPSPDLPQIILIVDEFKSLPRDVKDGIETIADKGRSAAVRLILSSLDPTAAGIPTAVLNQCRERVGLRMMNEASIRYLFDGGGAWRSRIDPASLTHPGMGLVSTNAQPHYQFKGWWMDPADTDAAAVRLGPRLRDLDEPSQQMFDTVLLAGGPGQEPTEYTNLWEGFWEMTKEAMFPNGATTSGPAGSGQVPPPRVPEAKVDMAGGMTLVNNALADMAAAGAALAEGLKARAEADNQQATEEDQGDAEDGDPDHPGLVDGRPGVLPNPAFDELVAGLTVLQAKERYRQLLQESGPTGATAICDRLRAEGHGTSRQTVHDWLKSDASRGLAQRTDDGWIWTGPTP
jgi:hypothetical protein